MTKPAPTPRGDAVKVVDAALRQGRDVRVTVRDGEIVVETIGAPVSVNPLDLVSMGR